ncbi:MAG: LPP20 family lipoprotein [Bacteroidota bacterium]
MALSFYGGSMKYLLLIVLVSGLAEAQLYPRWFLTQDQVKCKRKVVTVMKAPSLYADSAVALGFRTACDLLAKYTNVNIKGGQAFWTTEAGVHSMGASYTESYDIELGDFFQTKLKVIDAFYDSKKTIVLAGDSSSCSLSEELKEKVSMESVKRPSWVEDLPSDQRTVYGVGTSEEYYYESSSWQRAEHNAVMSLARSTRSSLVSMQKKNAIESQDLFNEDVDVDLQNIQIVARWRDVKNKVFYVLARTTL